MYSLLLAIIYIAFISLGLPDSLLGSGRPVMQSDFGVPLSYAGIVSTIVAPPLFGILADYISIGLYPFYQGLFAVLMPIMTSRTNRALES